eukprot:CAMPEP_0119339008 /NCGR_PEP_ID=MMETSP1333-20130426/97368_1 /TAXON_ID=418940 /ORGANISM="Scyphosphaera apsteinii, Strain RCC1455" /LENGTH=79 /DNA_ID=CAMNT_0007350443 /DNA_START=462 /DNA_END=701 /DNA_ORIENTATION=+
MMGSCNVELVCSTATSGARITPLRSECFGRSIENWAWQAVEAAVIGGGTAGCIQELLTPLSRRPALHHPSHLTASLEEF